MDEIKPELRRLIAAFDAQLNSRYQAKGRQMPHDPWGLGDYTVTWGATAPDYSTTAQKIFNTPDDGRCHKWSENPEERDMAKVNTFDRYELQNLRSKLATEAQEAREEEMRALISGYGEDTHPVGTIFKTEKALRKGEKPTPFIFVKTTDEMWRSTVHGGISWDNLIDYLIGEGAPVAVTDLVKLVPAADTELVSNETPAA